MKIYFSILIFCLLCLKGFSQQQLSQVACYSTNGEDNLEQNEDFLGDYKLMILGCDTRHGFFNNIPVDTAEGFYYHEYLVCIKKSGELQWVNPLDSFAAPVFTIRDSTIVITSANLWTTHDIRIQYFDSHGNAVSPIHVLCPVNSDSLLESSLWGAKCKPIFKQGNYILAVHYFGAAYIGWTIIPVNSYKLMYVEHDSLIRSVSSYRDVLIDSSKNRVVAADESQLGSYNFDLTASDTVYDYNFYTLKAIYGIDHDIIMEMKYGYVSLDSIGTRRYTYNAATHTTDTMNITDSIFMLDPTYRWSVVDMHGPLHFVARTSDSIYTIQQQSGSGTTILQTLISNDTIQDLRVPLYSDTDALFLIQYLNGSGAYLFKIVYVKNNQVLWEKPFSDFGNVHGDIYSLADRIPGTNEIYINFTSYYTTYSLLFSIDLQNGNGSFIAENLLLQEGDAYRLNHEDYVLTQTHPPWSCYPNADIVLYKTVHNYNTLHGKVFLDSIRNGVQDSSERLLKNAEVWINGYPAVSSSPSGEFSIVLDTGTYTVVLKTQKNTDTILPGVFVVHFSGYNESDTIAFAIRSIDSSLLTTTINYKPGKDIRIYPNPAGEVIHIAMPENSLGNSKLMLYDLSGKEILNKEFTSKNIDLNTGDITNGVYLLRITNDDFSLSAKIIVARK